jgi:carboxypeptidase D
MNTDDPVDQPPGTGYSFVPTNGYLHELDQVGTLSSRSHPGADDQASQHLIKFLDNFYQVFPELKAQDVSSR